MRINLKVETKKERKKNRTRRGRGWRKEGRGKKGRRVDRSKNEIAVKHFAKRRF